MGMELNRTMVPLIVPAGYLRSWNADYCCGFALWENVDDLQFFDDLRVEANRLFPFFNNLTYVSGHSNGAFMTSKISIHRNIDKAYTVEGFTYDLAFPTQPKAIPFMMLWGGADDT